MTLEYGNARIEGDSVVLTDISVDAPNENGEAGDVAWNFEKFLVDGTGTVVARFTPQVEPEDERIVAAIQNVLG